MRISSSGPSPPSSRPPLSSGLPLSLRSPLEMQDIAQIKSLLPDVVSFAYISSDLLRVHASTQAPSDDPRVAKRQQKARELDEAFRAGGAGEDRDAAGGEKREQKETVLLFAFNDGELKSENGAGKIVTRKFQSVASCPPSLPHSCRD